MFFYTLPLFAQDSLNVTQVGQLLLYTGSVDDVAVSGGYAYLACDMGLLITTSSTPVQQVGFLAIPPGIDRVTVSGNYAYVTDNDTGFWVIDVSNPAYPVEMGFLEIPG